MAIPQEFWPSPEESNPKARELLREEWFWSSGDDNSPHGSDNGADTYLEFHQWLLENPGADSSDFILEALDGLHIREIEWDCLDDTQLGRVLANHDNAHQLLIWDDAMISLAFGQLILEGKVHPELWEKALVASKRQGLPTIVAYREWDDPKERLGRLAIMQGILEKF